MLTHKTSKLFWNQLCNMPAKYFVENKAIIAKVALLIYRKCGKDEAKTFINLCRFAEVIE